MLEKRRLGSICALFLLFVILAAFSYRYIDTNLAIYIKEHFTPKQIKLFEVLTLPIEPLLTPSLLILVFIFSTKAASFIKLFTDFSTATLVNLSFVPVVKALFPRPRPSYFLSHGLYEIMPFHFMPEFISMPSGHASGAGLISAFIYLYMQGKKRLLMVLPITFMCFRILCLKHYVSDCLVGFGIGFCMVLLFYKRSETLINKIKAKLWINGKTA